MGKTQIHWLAPVSMLATLGGAVVLVVGHHLFYQSLDGNPVSSGSVFGSPISKQQANISIGLAFAFVIKASLVFSMSIAFSQLFWREATVSSSPPTLASLDVMYSAFDNIMSLLNIKHLWRYPLLPVVGTTAWLIPLASIIAPATLSIQMAAVIPAPTTLTRVPNLDFRSMVFTASMPLMLDFSGTSNIGTYLYNGPSQAVAETTNAVMAQGQLSYITPPASNSSWTLDLMAPYVKCEDVDSDMHQRFRRNIFTSMKGLVNANLYSYLAWLPQSGWVVTHMDRDVPFLGQFKGATPVFNPGLFPGSEFTNISFYVVSMPSMFDVGQKAVTNTFNKLYNNTFQENESAPIPKWIDGSMLQCVLLNSTYRASFKYVEGIQHIDIQANATSDRIQPIQQVLGPMALGSDDQCLNPTNITEDQEKSCYNNADVIRRLSYQAILDAFTANILGSISVDGYQQMQRNSSILNTALVDTKELAFLKTKAAAWDINNQTLQQIMAASDERDMMGLSNSDNAVAKLPLARAIEQMFQNVTISQMSSSLLQPNYSSISAPQAVNVTRPLYQNMYVYSAIKLWAAYGVAILLASLAVLLGLITMFLNGAAYSQTFSTVFRAARGAGMSEKIRDSDVAGEDPLPKRLATAQILFAFTENDEQERNRAQYRSRSR